LEELKLTSIQRQDQKIQQYTLFCSELPSDFAAEMDIQPPKTGAAFNSEKNQVRGISRRTGTQYLDLTRSSYDTLFSILIRIHKVYAQCSLQNVQLDNVKKVLIINIKGAGMRYCPIINREHRSNRVFFCVYLRTGYLQLKCFDLNCKKRLENLKPEKKCKKPSKEFKKPSKEDVQLRKVINIKLPENVWKTVCETVGVKFSNNSYSAKPQLTVFPATNIVQSNVNSHEQKVSDKTSIQQKSVKKELSSFLSKTNDFSDLLRGFK
jgi:hypothetical protein